MSDEPEVPSSGEESPELARRPQSEETDSAHRSRGFAESSYVAWRKSMYSSQGTAPEHPAYPTTSRNALAGWWERSKAFELTWLLSGVGLASLGQIAILLDRVPLALALYLVGTLLTVRGLLILPDRPSTVAEPSVGQGWSEHHVYLIVTAVALVVLGQTDFGRRVLPGEGFAFYLLGGLVFALLAAVGARRPRRPQLTIELAGIISVLILATVIRVYNLDRLPFGLWGDEANYGMEALQVLEGSLKTPFTTDWAGTPALKGYINALSVAAFGTTAFAIRLPAAIAGVLSILATYLLGREMFSARVGFIAAALLTVLHWHLHRSRFDSVVMMGVPIAVFAFYFSFRGLRTRQPGDFALSGLLLGLSPLFYHGNKIVPFIYLLLLVYLLLEKRSEFLRPYWANFSLALLGALLMFGPMLVYYLQYPDVLFGRPSSVLVFNNPEQFGAAHPGQHSVLEIVWLQFVDTMGAFHYRGDGSPVSNLPHKPMLDSFTALAMTLGLGYALALFRDRRYGFLLIWFFLTLLLGSMLTVDAPNSARITGILPALALLASVFLSRLWEAGERAPNLWRSAIHSSLVAALVVVGVSELDFYFNVFANPRNTYVAFGGQQTTTALYAKGLGPGYEVHLLSTIDTSATTSTLTYLAHGVRLVDHWSLSDLAPLPVVPRQNVAYAASDPAPLSYLSLIYPGGRIKTSNNPASGRADFAAYELDRQAIVSRQGLLGHYQPSSGASGVALDRLDAGLSFDWDADSALPSAFHAIWQGSLLASEAGEYLFDVETAGRLRLTLDGVPVLDSSMADQTSRRVYLARGLHPLEMSYEGERKGTTEVLWTPPSGQRAPVPATALYSQPLNIGLLGSYYRNPDWQGVPAFRQIDPLLWFRWSKDDLPFGEPVREPFSVQWDGVIHVPSNGTYTFELWSINSSWLYLDGQPVIGDESEGLEQRQEASVALEAGDHEISLRYAWREGPRELWLRWQAPTGEAEVIPPAFLSPSPSTSAR